MSPLSDTIVIGAGIIGCAIADELQRRGVAVTIVDDRPAGMGATQASAGVLAPFIEAGAHGPLQELTVRSLDLYDDFISRISAESGAAIQYQRTGTLDVATSDAELHNLRSTAELLTTRGVAAHLLDAAAVRAEEPQLGDGVVGGLIIDTHGFVAAGDLTRALLASAKRVGARFVEHRRVRRIASRGAGVVVETDRGELTAAAVVLAAGSWSGQIAIDGVTVAVPVRPVRGQLLWLTWVDSLLRRVTWSARCYMVPWQDGTVLLGATVEEAGFDERATVAGVRGLMDAACEVVPHACVAGFRGARVGLRPATTDGLPVIGMSGVVPNLMYASGHYRNGVLLAPLTAQLVADAMIDGRVDPLLTRLSPSRFGAL